MERVGIRRIAFIIVYYKSFVGFYFQPILVIFKLKLSSDFYRPLHSLFIPNFIPNDPDSNFSLFMTIPHPSLLETLTRLQLI